MKMIFRNESRICNGQGNNAGTFIWYCSNLTKGDNQKETIQFPQVINGVGMSFQGSKEMVIITTTINANVYIEILDNILVSSIRN